MRPLLLKLHLAAFLALWSGSASAAKVACVGDSITFGYGLSDPDTQSYPAVLQGLLGSEHTVGNFGVSGATLLKSGDLPYWDEPAFQQSAAFEPDVVVVMLGTNDTKPDNWANGAQFPTDYHALIEHYRELGAVVYAATPPPVFGSGAFDISPSVVQLEVVPLVMQIAVDAEAPLVDVFEAARDSASWFPDTVHPNAEGARLIAETVEASLIANNFDAGGMTGSGGTSGAVSSVGGSSPGGAGGSGVGGTAGGGAGTSSVGTASGTADSSTAGGTSMGGSSTQASASANTNAGPTTSASSGFGGSTSSSTTQSSSSTGSAMMEETQPTRNSGGGGCQLGGRQLPGSAWLALLLALLGSRRVRRRWTL